MTDLEKTFEWAHRIVESCNNDFHFAVADNVITLFNEMYGVQTLVDKLIETRVKRWQEIHTELV